MSTASSLDFAHASSEPLQGALHQPQAGLEKPQSFSHALSQAPKTSPFKPPPHPNAASASVSPGQSANGIDQTATPSNHNSNPSGSAAVSVTLHVAEDSSAVQVVLSPAAAPAVAAEPVQHTDASGRVAHEAPGTSAAIGQREFDGVSVAQSSYAGSLGDSQEGDALCQADVPLQSPCSHLYPGVNILGACMN